MGLDLEWRGLRNMPATEEHVQVMMGYEKWFGRGGITWKGKITAAVDNVTNPGYVDGEEETGYYLAIVVSGTL